MAIRFTGFLISCLVIIPALCSGIDKKAVKLQLSQSHGYSMPITSRGGPFGAPLREGYYVKPVGLAFFISPRIQIAYSFEFFNHRFHQGMLHNEIISRGYDPAQLGGSMRFSTRRIGTGLAFYLVDRKSFALNLGYYVATGTTRGNVNFFDTQPTRHEDEQGIGALDMLRFGYAGVAERAFYHSFEVSLEHKLSKTFYVGANIQLSGMPVINLSHSTYDSREPFRYRRDRYYAGGYAFFNGSISLVRVISANLP